VHRQQPEHVDAAALTEAASALDLISSNSQNAVPDSVLNAAKCIITVPSLPQAAGQINARGVASCREGADWEAPITVIFSGQLDRQTPAVLLVMVMTDKGISALRSGEITVHKSHRKAPLVSTTPLVTQFELTSDYLMYQAANTGLLAPGEAIGSFRVDQSSWGSAQASKVRVSGAKHASGPSVKYERSLQSFVNTIIPTGIVIHHTALITSEKLPSGEKEVDEYHQRRGFEIYCFGQVYHVAYHYLVLPDGSVQHGRPERCEGAHARGYNSYIGISVIGDFSSRDNPKGTKGPEKPTPKQLETIVELCRTLRQKYRIPLQHVVRHSDIASTDCPGDRFPFNRLLSRLEAEAKITKVSVK